MSENKLTYGVILLRTDGNHIVVEEVDNYDVAFSKWTEMKDHWVKCLHEKLPFIVTKPIVTAFDPTFVYEIIIKPKVISNNSSISNNNPYTKDMLKNGFGSTFQKNTVTSGGDLLDRGYSI